MILEIWTYIASFLLAADSTFLILHDDVTIPPTYPILHDDDGFVIVKKVYPTPSITWYWKFFHPNSDLHELPWKFHLHLYCVLKRALFREIWPFCTEPCEFHTSLFSLLYPLYIVMPDKAYSAKKVKTNQQIHRTNCSHISYIETLFTSWYSGHF